MSFHVLPWAWAQDLPMGGKLLLVKLADQANDDGECWPSKRKLIEDTGLSSTTVKRWLRQLAEDGLISRSDRRDASGRSRSNLYTLNFRGEGATVTPLEGAAMTPPIDIELPEGTMEEASPLPSGPKAKRKPDPLWDALAVVLRVQPETKSERGRWNAALKEIREADGTPDDIKRRAKVYREIWPGVSLTATALAANWGTLRPKATPGHVCPECGIGGGEHLKDCPTIQVMTEDQAKALGEQIARRRA